MSQWFRQRRQEFIAATLRQFGQVRRADLIREFDISVPLASTDIAVFLANDPPHVRYDVSAKAYVLDLPAQAPEKSQDMQDAREMFDAGFMACWAEASVKNGQFTALFPLSDSTLDRAWEIHLATREPEDQVDD